MKENEVIKTKLKYLYFIDVDSLIKEINDEINKIENTADLFQIIFSKIVTYTAPYSGFITSNNATFRTSFFGENLSSNELDLYYYLSGISLFHHCVIQETISKLYSTLPPLEDSTKLHEHDFLDYMSPTRSIKLSASTDTIVSKGFKSCLDMQLKHTSILSGSSEHKKFYKKCKDLNKRTDFFTFQYLDSKKNLTQLPEAFLEDNLHYYFEKHFSSAALFMLNDKSLRTFNKNLLRENVKHNNFKKLINDYCSIYKSTLGNVLASKEDNIIFHSILEDAYGFSFFYYIMKELSSFEADNAEYNIANIFGNNFNDIVCNLASRTPITNNRAIFFKYAISALKASPHVRSDFPIKSDRGSYCDNEVKPLHIWASDAIKQLNAFYTTLNNIIIPLFEDMWHIVTNEINYTITLADYSSFINQNYEAILLNYSAIDPIDFISKNNHKPFDKINLSYITTYQYLLEYSKTNKQDSYTDFANVFVNLSLDKQILFNEFITRYCTVYSNPSFEDSIFLDYEKTPNQIEHIDVLSDFKAQHIENMISYSLKTSTYVPLKKKI